MSISIPKNLTAAFTAEMEKVERRQTHRMSSALDRFHEILNRLSPPPTSRPIHVVSKRVMEAIQKQTHPSSSRNPLSLFEHYAGIDIAMKENQDADCLIFSQRETADAYLAGLITEQQVLEIAKPFPTQTQP